ncbi:MAG: type II toxin-antitoxin system RelE/ParE family toxin [Acidobacteria bacterium]|nr:type II toxin-antitoxin system RelE/ParE family toxin [Acidobacteriota bacterium]MBI3655884.1 type II toxin-antitoxin system RelE/ParE family toxin [Acidobacteriota bacterium]
MRGFLLSPEAAQDLTEIWEFLAEESIAAARRVRKELYEAIGGLVKMPSKGHVREDLTGKPVLFWTVRSYHIIYRPGTKPLQIIGVLHGARAIPTVLKNR